MAFFLAKHVLPKTLPAATLLRSLASRGCSSCNGGGGGSGSNNDDCNRNLQNELNNLHSYETIDDPNSLVKTTIIKRNPVLQQPKTPEQMLEEAARTIASRSPEEEPQDGTTLFESGLSDVGDNDCYTDLEKNIYGEQHGKSSIVGYDIFQELEERLQEILSRDEEDTGITTEKQDQEPSKEEDNKKLSKLGAALDGLNRLLDICLFRSSRYQKHW